MLKYFNSGYFTRTLVLIFIAVVLWLPAFLLPAKTIVPEQPAPLYQLFLFLTINNTYLHLSIAFFLSITSALLLNQITTEFGLTEKISQLGMLVYILFSSALISQTAMHPVILVNFLMLLLLRSLFKLIESKEHILLIFNASFIIGIASLIYPPTGYLFLLVWIAILVFNVSHWRNFAVSLIGILLPFLFAFTWYFWNDLTPKAYSLLLSSFEFHLPNTLSFSLSDWIIASFLLLFLLIAVAKTNSDLMEKNINIRQMLIVSLNYLAISFVVVLFFSTSSADVLLLAVPASIIAASTLTGIRKVKWYEWALRFTILLILFNQYFQLFYAA